MDGLWYEIADVAQGDDVYAGIDTWEPFHSAAHVRGGRARAGPAARRRRRLRAGPAAAAAGLRGAARPGAGMEPADAVARDGGRPAGGGGLPGRARLAPAGRAPPTATLFRRLRPALPGAAAHGRCTATGRPTTCSSRATGSAASSTSTRPTTARACSTWRPRSSATASSGTGSRPARTTPSTSSTPGSWSSAYHAGAPAVAAERAALPDVLACLPVRVRDLVPRLLLGRRARPREGRLGLAHVRARPCRSGGRRPPGARPPVRSSGSEPVWPRGSRVPGRARRPPARPPR